MSGFMPKPLKCLWRVGVFIDVQSIYMCVKSVLGHTKINYKVLRDFLTRDGVLVKMVAFTCYDPENCSQWEIATLPQWWITWLGWARLSKSLVLTASPDLICSCDQFINLSQIDGIFTSNA